MQVMLSWKSKETYVAARFHFFFWGGRGGRANGLANSPPTPQSASCESNVMSSSLRIACSWVCEVPRSEKCKNWICTWHYISSFQYIIFSFNKSGCMERTYAHDVQNNKTAVSLVNQTNPVWVQRFSYLNTFFCFINLFDVSFNWCCKGKNAILSLRVTNLYACALVVTRI